MNKLTVFNQNIPIFNGKEYEELALSPWHSKMQLNAATNGLRFKPRLEDSTIKYYEASLVRNLNYKRDTNANGKIGELNTHRYNQDNNFGMNMGFNQTKKGLMQAGPSYLNDIHFGHQYCNGCDRGLLTKVQVNQKPYGDLVDTGSKDFYLQVQPESGFTIEDVKTQTAFQFIPKGLPIFPDLNLDANTDNADPTTVDGVLVPLFDTTYKLSINKDKFLKDFNFISEDDKAYVKLVWISAIVGIVMFVIALVFLIMFCVCFRK